MCSRNAHMPNSARRVAVWPIVSANQEQIHVGDVRSGSRIIAGLKRKGINMLVLRWTAWALIVGSGLVFVVALDGLDLFLISSAVCGAVAGVVVLALDRMVRTLEDIRSAIRSAGAEKDHGDEERKAVASHDLNSLGTSIEAAKKRRAKNKAKASNKVALRDRWLSSGFLGAVFGAPFGLLVGAVISLMTNNHGFMGFGAVIGAIVLGSIGLRGS